MADRSAPMEFFYFKSRFPIKDRLILGVQYQRSLTKTPFKIRA